MHDQGRADRQALFNSFAVIAMIFSAGTLFFYYDVSRLKAEEIRSTLESRALLAEEMRRSTDATKQQSILLKELIRAVQDFRKSL